MFMTKNRIMEIKKPIVILLLIVPLLFFIIGLSMLSAYPPHFTLITDPEYCHLLTGLNIAQFKFISADYMHPCVPMQLLTGAIIRLVYFFAGQEANIVSDVFQRPEFYVSAINISFILVIAILFFIVGNIVASITGEVLVGIFLQTIVFANHITLFQLTVSVPERLALPFIALLICLLIWYIYKGSMPPNYPILLGVAVGFCVMQKYTMLPLVILPLFITKTWKERLLYFLSFIVTFALLFIPIISHLKRIREFFTGMFSHSGLYGSGKAQFFDLSSVAPNLSVLFHDMAIPMFCMLILIIFLPIVYLVKINKSEIILRIRKIMLGTALVEVIILLMVLKHYKTHYFAPAAAFSFFNLFLCYEYIKQRFLPNNTLILKIALGMFCFIPLLDYSRLKSDFTDYRKKTETEKLLHQVEVYYRDYPTLIIPRYYGSPFIEFSLWTANYYTYNMKQYGTELKELYPLSYIYTLDWGTFDMAYDGHKTNDILLRHDMFLLSYYPEDTAIVNSFFRELNALNKTYTFKRTLYNKNLGYAIGEIRFVEDSTLKESVFAYSQDMETKDSIVSNLISTVVAKSGIGSLKLDDQHEFGAVVPLNDIKPGDKITASVWRYNNLNKSSIAIRTENSDDLFVSNSGISQTFNLWHQIKIETIIPDTFRQQSLRVYLWHSDKRNDAYFDDYSVSVARE